VATFAVSAALFHDALPSSVETIQSDQIHRSGEFVESNLGTAMQPDGSALVRLVLQQFSFSPSIIKVPVNTPVVIRAVSADVIHGFLLEGTNVNAMVVPGYVTTVRARFNHPGEYLVPCKLLIEKAEAKARSLGRAVNIAVVDSGGNLLAFERMDGAFLAGVDLCQGKARSALRFEEPTAKIEATIHDGRYALMTAGAIEMQGGIPILRGGSIIGAIGVSGDSSTDVPIAESAVTDLE